MAEIAAEMLREALNAFTSEDAQASRRIIARDLEVDQRTDAFLTALSRLWCKIRPPQTVPRGCYLSLSTSSELATTLRIFVSLNVYLTEAVFIKHSIGKSSVLDIS